MQLLEDKYWLLNHDNDPAHDVFTWSFNVWFFFSFAHYHGDHQGDPFRRCGDNQESYNDVSGGGASKMNASSSAEKRDREKWKSALSWGGFLWRGTHVACFWYWNKLFVMPITSFSDRYCEMSRRCEIVMIVFYGSDRCMYD